MSQQDRCIFLAWCFALSLSAVLTAQAWERKSPARPESRVVRPVEETWTELLPNPSPLRSPARASEADGPVISRVRERARYETN